MPRRVRLLILFLLPPAIATVLWLRSGREHLTKSMKSVEIRRHDDLFGGDEIVHEFKRGPIAGYFVGLDAVAVATVASVVLVGVSWITTRRPAQRDPAPENPS
jgi:hypothetical protein